MEIGRSIHLPAVLTLGFNRASISESGQIDGGDEKFRLANYDGLWVYLIRDLLETENVQVKVDDYSKTREQKHKTMVALFVGISNAKGMSTLESLLCSR
jgi:hypothetical protein